ncbi:MAG: hypothetical protein CVT81_10210 [Alphaproteobacteria bacterium HGW-Alphaproteobacteria-3]|nr:MAG: hypothetical protein CVT81_10210 [Alphaproteobacteria bacterium HGW-Alphaproteobacteria-3]
MNIKWVSLFFVPLAFGCAAATASPPAAESCEIRAIETPSGMLFESVVYGMPGETGSYAVSFERSGSGGTSEVRQDGDFVIEESGEAVVSVTEVNRGARDRFHAHMTVESYSGSYSCGL